MDKRMKHRILGVFVILGLIVLLLPFFQSSNELPSEDALLQAPPFPNQSQQQSQTNLANDYIADVPAVAPVAKPTTLSENTPPRDTVDPATIPTDVQAPAIANPMTDGTKTPSNDATPPATLEEKTATDTQASANTSEQSEQGLDTQTTKSKQAVHASKSTPQHLSLKEKRRSLAQSAKKHVSVQQNGKKTKIEVITPHLASKLTKHLRDVTIESKGLSALNDPAWVVQVGSFKHKTNAIRLVNKLRAKGYRTFLQHIDSSDDEQSRVFVGPELQQSAARKLAQEIEQREKIHGFVLSYKPLQL